MELNLDKVLICMRGVAGSGKSSIATALSLGMYPVLAADDFFMKDGVYRWDPKLLHLAHKNCQERCRNAMETGEKRIFVCNTFIRASDIKPYMELAGEFNYTFFSCIVENHHGNKDVHNVPDEKRVEMEKNLRNNLKLI